MCWYNLVYITFSRIFEKDASNETVLKTGYIGFVPFLCKGFISENFNQEGKIPLWTRSDEKNSWYSI